MLNNLIKLFENLPFDAKNIKQFYHSYFLSRYFSLRFVDTSETFAS